MDNAQDALGNETLISAPKTIERLEKIALDAAKKRREEEDEEDEEDDDDDDRITIGGKVDSDTLNIDDMSKKIVPTPIVLHDIEIIS